MLCILYTHAPHMHEPHSNWCALLKFAYFYCDVKHDSFVRCERAARKNTFAHNSIPTKRCITLTFAYIKHPSLVCMSFI